MAAYQSKILFQGGCNSYLGTILTPASLDDEELVKTPLLKALIYSSPKTILVWHAPAPKRQRIPLEAIRLLGRVDVLSYEVSESIVFVPEVRRFHAMLRIILKYLPASCSCLAEDR